MNMLQATVDLYVLIVTKQNYCTIEEKTMLFTRTIGDGSSSLRYPSFSVFFFQIQNALRATFLKVEPKKNFCTNIFRGLTQTLDDLDLDLFSKVVGQVTPKIRDHRYRPQI